MDLPLLSATLQKKNDSAGTAHGDAAHIYLICRWCMATLQTIFPFVDGAWRRCKHFLNCGWCMATLQKLIGFVE
jgi:hypothetical protein